MTLLKKSHWLSVPVICLAFIACEAAEEDDEGNEDLIPTSVIQSGVRGSWARSEANSSIVSSEWYIETNRTTLASRCLYQGKVITAVVQVRSRLQGSILTFEDSDSESVKMGNLACSATATEDSAYVLNLNSSNRLSITSSGVAKEFSRMMPVDENDERDDQ